MNHSFLSRIKLAERTGFEPANQFCRLHAFQACLFNRSSTSPLMQRYKEYWDWQNKVLEF